MGVPDISGDSGCGYIHRVAFELLFKTFLLVIEAVKPFVVLLVAKLTTVCVEEGNVLQAPTLLFGILCS